MSPPFSGQRQPATVSAAATTAVPADVPSNCRTGHVTTTVASGAGNQNFGEESATDVCVSPCVGNALLAGMVDEWALEKDADMFFLRNSYTFRRRAHCCAIPHGGPSSAGG